MIRTLGKETSSLGMGCWAIGGEWSFLGTPAGWGASDDAESLQAIQAAYDNGIRLFDTAANYGCGHSERLLAKALGKQRQDCVISTKFGFELDEEKREVTIRGESMKTMPVRRFLEADCEASLRRLNTDYIDVYFFHSWEYEADLAQDLMEGLERLVEAGKIRCYGWSTDDADSVRLFAKGEHCGAVQINFSVAVDQAEILSICSDADIAAFNRGPLAMGFLTGKYDASSTFSSTDVRTNQWVADVFQKPVSAKLPLLREALAVGGRTLAQGALAYIWARSETTFPIPGIRTVAQARENARAMEFGPLSADEAAAVDRIMDRSV